MVRVQFLAGHSEVVVPIEAALATEHRTAVIIATLEHLVNRLRNVEHDRPRTVLAAAMTINRMLPL